MNDRGNISSEQPTVLGIFAEDLRTLQLPLPIEGAEQARSEVSGALSQLADHVAPRLASLDAPLLVVVGGSTGAGKSTLVNRLVPGADRATGVVSGVGKGRHTSTQSVALPLAGGGWAIDTPGIRSFGLAHVTPETVLDVFEDLAAAIVDCPRGCTHLGPPADPECALDKLEGASHRRAMAVRGLLVTLQDNEDWELDIDRD